MGTQQQDDELQAEEIAFESYYEQKMLEKYENQIKYFLGVEDE